ncbi:hypothetical protein DRJ22_04615 [Candidatus Woesearchaeota archaeon]|nr:MAG: hypothetical protein DRJ22_04615 [Candidatus Woesearchaeota archaeon]
MVQKHLNKFVLVFGFMIDVVLPDKNSDLEEFRSLASALGWDDVIFLSDDLKASVVLAEAKQISSLKRSKVVFCRGSREAIERGAHVLFGFESAVREDFLHHRASGLNHVLCRLAKKHGSFVAFNFSSVLVADDFFRAKIIGRMQQNIRLCRKYRIPMLPLSFARVPFEMRGLLDFRSFFVELGMHPKEFVDGQEKFRDLLDKFSKPL